MLIKLRRIAAGVSPPFLPAVPFAALPPVSRRFSAYRAPRRAVLGLGFSFLSQFIGMAAPSIGAKSFVASARQKGAVEKVLENVEWPEQFPFKDEDFQRFDDFSD